MKSTAPHRVPATPSAQRCLCARLRRASRALTQLYDDAMAPAGLRLTQFSLLRMLARHGTTTITTLAATLLLDRTALSRNLDPLIARKLVSVAPGPDARTREVTLTAAGHRVVEAAQPHWAQAQATVAKKVGEQRLVALYDVLEYLETLHPSLAHAASQEAQS